jgi:hypothetical protein
MQSTAQKLSKKRSDVSQYEPDTTQSMTKRIAHFLDWAADNMPKEFLQYNVVLKAVMGYKHLPRLETKEVEFVRSAITRVRKVLLETYRRGTVTMPGVGVRATVDDSDMVVHDVTKKGKRVQSAVKSFTEAVNIVNPANIPKTPEMAPYTKYVRDAKEVAAVFGSKDFLNRLLPPKTEKAEEKK